MTFKFFQSDLAAKFFASNQIKYFWSGNASEPDQIRYICHPDYPQSFQIRFRIKLFCFKLNQIKYLWKGNVSASDQIKYICHPDYPQVLPIRYRIILFPSIQIKSNLLYSQMTFKFFKSDIAINFFASNQIKHFWKMNWS